MMDALLSNAADFIWAVDADMAFCMASDSFARFLGLERGAELEGVPVAQVIKDPSAVRRHARDDREILKTGRSPAPFVDTVVGAGGAVRYMLCSKFAVPGPDGRPEAALCVARDVSREYEAREDYLREVQYLLEIGGDAYGAWLFDLTAWRVADARFPEGAHDDVAQQQEVDGYVSAALATISDNDEARSFLENFKPETLRAMYKSGRRAMDFEYRRRMAEGPACWVRLSLRFLSDPVTAHLMAAVSLTDINKAKSAHSDLLKAAEADSMTGVLNHDATLSRISAYLSGEGAGGGHALIMVDRDGLKQINDTLGHQVGDDIIIETARMLKGLFRDADIVGRVGGDEFLVLMKNFGRLQTVRRKASELLQSLHCICGPADAAVESTGSIGVAIYSGDGKTFDRLYAEADAALYKAKADGRNRFVFFGGDENGGEAGLDLRDPVIDTVNLRTLLNSIDGGILILHTEPGKALLPVFFSDSFLIMMGGLTQDEAFGLYGGDLFECIHPDERERVKSEYAAAISSGEPLRTTYRLAGKDGEYYWLSAGASITKNEDGKIDVYAVHTNIEKLMHREEKLASDERRFRIAFSQTSRMLCEIDVDSDTLYFYTRENKLHAPDGSLEGMPEAIIASGFMSERSAEAMRAFYKAMKEGRAEDKGLFLCRYFSTGEYGWASISYQMVFTPEGRPQRAIGSIEELPGIARAQERLSREETLMSLVREDCLAAMRANLSRNGFEFADGPDGSCFAAASAGSYSAFVDAAAGESPYPEDAMLLQLNFQRERLLEAHAAGRRWVTVEYRRVDGGEIRWTKMTASLIEEPVTREIHMFIYVSDVEKRRSAEVLLPVTVKRDSVTHLYTQDTIERLIEILMRGGGDRRYSLALLKIAGLPVLSARIGAENVDLEKMYLSRFLCSTLDGDCFVGRYGGDGILVFCPDSVSDEWMRLKIEGAVLRARSHSPAAEGGHGIRLVCGVTTENAVNADFAGMLSQAARVCESVQEPEGDKVSSFEQYVDSFRASAETLEKTAFIIVAPEELSRPLFGAERAAMHESMSAMLASDRFDSSVSAALGVLGRYYGAQRVYTLSLIGDGNSVSGLHEWVAPGRHSTLRQMAGVPLSRLPVFKRALAAARPVILDGSLRRTSLSGDAPWCFIVLPVITEGRVQGFLCVENPEKHRSDAALPAALIPLLLHERARFNLGAAGMKIAGRDELTGLPDRSAFESAMQVFNPDAYHAIGVFYVSVLNLREQNRINGVAYGDDMLVFTAHTLSDVAKKASVYRTSGQEFALVSVNLSREAFQAQCARCQSILQRRYPKVFCFGDAWSGKGASARKLLAQAESLAHDGAGLRQVASAKPERAEAGALNLQEALSEGRFFIYLQPQMDMRTGRAVGAEALARCRDPSGRTILPGEFVHALEEAGRIRELDYLVLDKVFQTLQGWIARGLAPVPVSVNFSRQTLLSGTALASVIAISSRYDVPEKLVKIEMTESVGDYEPEPVREIMDSIRQHGFSFSLDDLGSEYSSLKTLGDLTFDEVKLDRSLIGNFLFNTMNRSVVESIVGVCAKNRIKCIAEGVESEAQVKGLLETGCVLAQGYYYGKPMPAEDFGKRFLK